MINAFCLLFQVLSLSIVLIFFICVVNAVYLDYSLDFAEAIKRFMRLLICIFNSFYYISSKVACFFFQVLSLKEVIVFFNKLIVRDLAISS